MFKHLVLWVMSALLVAAQNGDVLTNEIVIKMVQAGVPTATIIHTIAAADKVDFRFIGPDLQRLTDSRVPDDVFRAMVARDRGRPTPASPTSSAQTPSARPAAPQALQAQVTPPSPTKSDASDNDEENAFRVDSIPLGAHVIINGRDRGTTPFEMKLGRWAFDIKKTSVFSKHLKEPMVLQLSLEGYRTESLEVTRGPLIWRSFNGQNSYPYWVINSPSYSVRLRPLTRVLTNTDIIQLLKSGLSDALVIDKIQTSTCEFKTDLEDIAALKAAGVSEEVISAMLHALPLDPAGPATTIQPVKK